MILRVDRQAAFQHLQHSSHISLHQTLFVYLLPYQNFLRCQNNKNNYNLVCETLQFLDCICGSTTGGLGLLGLYINEKNVALINQTLESLTEYCQGPCHENQVQKYLTGKVSNVLYFVPFKAVLLVSCRIVSPPMSPMELTLSSPWFLTTSTHSGRSEWTWCWSWRWVEDKAPPLCEAEEPQPYSGFEFWPRQNNTFLSRRHSINVV